MAPTDPNSRSAMKAAKAEADGKGPKAKVSTVLGASDLQAAQAARQNEKAATAAARAEKDAAKAADAKKVR